MKHVPPTLDLWEGTYGPELDAMTPEELQGLPIAEFHKRALRKFGTRSPLLRPMLLAALARRDRASAEGPRLRAESPLQMPDAFYA